MPSLDLNMHLRLLALSWSFATPLGGSQAAGSCKAGCSGQQRHHGTGLWEFVLTQLCEGGTFHGQEVCLGVGVVSKCGRSRWQAGPGAGGQAWLGALSRQVQAQSQGKLRQKARVGFVLAQLLKQKGQTGYEQHV